MAGKKTVSKVEEVTDVTTQVITKEEQAFIDASREYAKKEAECQAELIAVLTKYKADLIVNLNSPIGKPSLKLVLQ